MKKVLFISLVFICIISSAQQTKLVSDCTINFSIDDGQQHNLGSKTIYLKGKDLRIDFTSSTFSQTTFYNNNTGNATVLKTVGQSKYISHYTADEWKKENASNMSSTMSLTGNTKTILNYECKEAIITLSNGVSYTVYYTPSILLSVSENPFLFKDVPGLVLQYESADSANGKIIFTATKIDFNPVPSLQFEIPKTGYRVLQ